MQANLALSCVFAFGCGSAGDISFDGHPPPPVNNPSPGDDWMCDVSNADGVAIEFFLSNLPNPGTIDVSVQERPEVVLYFNEAVGDPPVGDYDYNSPRNSVRFQRYVPPPESQVILCYMPPGPLPSR